MIMPDSWTANLIPSESRRRHCISGSEPGPLNIATLSESLILQRAVLSVSSISSSPGTYDNMPLS